ncbi:MAG TPA: hypothetical protein ENJ23_05035 [Bacteroidetes bacterium]|nr:hypothetical protein [Bacteroidota bacterium]
MGSFKYPDPDKRDLGNYGDIYLSSNFSGQKDCEKAEIDTSFPNGKSQTGFNFIGMNGAKVLLDFRAFWLSRRWRTGPMTFSLAPWLFAIFGTKRPSRPVTASASPSKIGQEACQGEEKFLVVAPSGLA